MQQTRRTLTAVLCGLVLMTVCADDPLRFVIDPQKKIGPANARALGINVNYLMDDDSNRPGPVKHSLADALKEMGVRTMRYPGGNKSDSYLWSTPPYEKAAPALALTEDRDWPACDEDLMMPDRRTFRIDPLDFDEFAALCHETGVEPTVVVCYDACHARADAHHGSIIRDELVKSAVAWVAYAKKIGLKVRYWEIGNESYFDDAISAEAYARDWLVFARAMKAVDSDIRIGANGHDSMRGRSNYAKKHDIDMPWWKTVLTIAGSEIDFLAVHSYPCYKWMGYDRYLKHKGDFAHLVKETRKALDAWAKPQDAKRIEIAITELNSADWFGHPKNSGWKHHNTLGHALVLFEMIGDYVCCRDLAFAQLWNTRWVKNDSAEIPQLWDALDPQNRLQPTGRALAIWHQFMPETMLRVRSADGLSAYAGLRADGSTVVMLINRTKAEKNVKLEFAEEPKTEAVDVWRFRGDGPDDTSPTWEQIDHARTEKAELNLSLAPVSLTVLQLD